MRFAEIKSLFEYFVTDTKSRGYYTRFPVRFIFLNDFSYLQSLLDYFKNTNINVVNLSNKLDIFRNNKDAWVSVSDILDVVKNSKDKRVAVIPISEIVRFYKENEFYTIFQSLIEIEDSSNENIRRIYIPLVGIKERFDAVFWSRYHRRNEWDPIWELHSDKKVYNLFLTSLDNDTKSLNNINIVDSTIEYLNLYNWYNKEDFKDTIVITSKTLYSLYDSLIDYGIYQITLINAIKDIIKYIFCLDISVEYRESEKEFWVKLLEEINKKQMRYFDQLIKEYFNVTALNIDDILKIVLDSKDDKVHNQKFKLWLLKLYIIEKKEFDNTYLKLVIDDLKEYDYHTFTNLYLLKIFDVKTPDKYINERINGLRILMKNVDTEVFKNILSEKFNHLPPECIPKYLTGLIDYEKELIIKNINTWKDFNIEAVYPELDYYLFDEDIKTYYTKDDIYQYIKEYKISKINNKTTDNFKDLINKLNNDSESFYSWFYEYKNIKNYINDGFDEIIQIDGLGIEYTSLIFKLLQKENENYSFMLQIARAELPSITEVNKIDGATFIRDLDKYIHDENLYNFPKTLIKEIEIIKTIAKKISDKLKLEKKKILITGDHGFSIFVISKYLGKNRYNFENAEHGGRCLKLKENENYNDSEDFIVYENINQAKYLIPLKHISLGQTPRGESHGGATPEEVLVPIIIAKKNKDVYSIKIFTDIIKIRDKYFKFIVEPKPNQLPVIYIENKKFTAKLIDYNKNEYCVELPSLKAGKKDILIEIGSYKEKFEIKIKGGMEEADLL